MNVNHNIVRITKYDTMINVLQKVKLLCTAPFLCWGVIKHSFILYCTGLFCCRLESTRQSVDTALRDDFNTPLAMEAIMDLIKLINIKLGRKTEVYVHFFHAQCFRYSKLSS